MKKIYLFVFLIFAASFSGKAQIANFNMETWTTLFGGTNPNGWVSNNVLTSNATVVQDGVTKHAGNFSAKIVTGVLNPNPLSAYMPDTSGFMISGGLSFVPTYSIKQGYPYTNRSDTLGVWAKYEGMGNDSGFIYVALTKRNALGTGARDTIASGTYFFHGTDPAFSFRNVTLDYASFGLPPTTLPDSALIIVSSSKRYGGQVGSKLWVDDFEWDPVGVGMQEKYFTPFSIFPSPAQNTLGFNFGLFSGKKSLHVFDITGKSVLETTLLESSGNIDISMLSEGFYQVMITDENGLTGSEKLIISGK